MDEKCYGDGGYGDGGWSDLNRWEGEDMKSWV